MTETNRVRRKLDAIGGDEFDRALDTALAKYMSADPRIGLEDRILARLHTERTKVNDRAWWRRSLSPAGAVLVTAAILSWIMTRPSHPVMVNRPVVATRQMSEPESKLSNVGAETVRVLAPTARKRSQRLSATSTTANPKLDVFPSPRPLSEQEQILTRYVAQFSKEATLVARAQTDVRLEDQQEMSEPIRDDKTDQ
jgi:hypothetical protein